MIRRVDSHRVLALLTVAACLAACAPGGRTPEGGEGLAAGGGPDAPAPNFTLASLEGRDVSTSDFAGQVVLIDFWATWCSPCHLQAEILRGLHEDFAGQGVQFLAVSLGEPEEVVRSFVDENPYPYPVLVDPEDRLSPELGIYVLPTVMVLDREGNVSYLQTGISQAEALRRALYEAGVQHPSTAA